MILKLGTRRSLLAQAQSSWVARKIEKLNPGIKVELVGIDTQGDNILDQPLSKIEGKEFFTAELDHALLDGKVDFTVHSMKDLSLDRPTKFKLAAIPERELQHDVIVFHESVTQRLQAGDEIRIGTSSPRRLTLIPRFLEKALPQFSAHSKPKLNFIEIRGNVNTRLSRIHEPEGSERKLDGVVLAFAGLERLTLDEKASLELWKLLEKTKLMIVPVRVCPSAPAQGALAIETLSDHSVAIEAIQKLNHSDTVSAVQEERKILSEWGGGCHQKLGANFVKTARGGKLYISGKKPDGTWVEETRFFGEQTPSWESFTKVEAKDLFEFIKKEFSPSEQKAFSHSEVCFIAHSRSVEFLDPALFTQLGTKRIWVSGMKSWQKLAQLGLWVEGSVEQLGFEAFQAVRTKKLLRIPDKITFLSHAESSSPDAQTTLVSSYAHQFRELPEKILKSTHLYWSSSLPFSTVWSMLGSPEKRAEFAKKVHASGTGKTASVLRAHGIEPVLMDSDA